MNHNLEALKAHILPLSKADNFFVARLEWRLTGMYLSEDFDSCPCGQDIKELCYIKNMATGNETYVGNICVKNFLGIDTGNLFKGLRRIAADYTANANKDLIEHAYQLGYIYENEYIFLLSTMHLSDKKLQSEQLRSLQEMFFT